MDTLLDFDSKLSLIAQSQNKAIPINYQGTSLKITKDLRYLIFTTRCGRLVVYDQITENTIENIQLSTSSLWNLDVSNDNSFILAGGIDAEIKRISFPYQNKISTLLGHTNEINHILISNDDNFAYSASDDGTIRE